MSITTAMLGNGDIKMNLEKMLITCLFDKATNLFGKLMLTENQDTALRQLQVLIDSQHLEKYTDKIFLYILGEYNIKTGQVDLYKNRVVVSYSGSVQKENKEITSETINN